MSSSNHRIMLVIKVVLQWFWVCNFLSGNRSEWELFWVCTVLSGNCSEWKLFWVCTVLCGNCSQCVLFWVGNGLSVYCSEWELFWVCTVLSGDFAECVLFWAWTVLIRNCSECVQFWLGNCSECVLFWVGTVLSVYCSECVLFWVGTVLSRNCPECVPFWACAVLCVNCSEWELFWVWPVLLCRCCSMSGKRAVLLATENPPLMPHKVWVHNPTLTVHKTSPWAYKLTWATRVWLKDHNLTYRWILHSFSAPVTVPLSSPHLCNFYPLLWSVTNCPSFFTYMSPLSAYVCVLEIIHSLPAYPD